MTGSILLTFNSGSSTIKLGIFEILEDGPKRLGRGVVDLNQLPLTLRITEGDATANIVLKSAIADELREFTDEIIGWLVQHFSAGAIAGVGHRVVHGGDRFAGPELVTETTLREIEMLVPLAPMHQPQSIRLMRAISHVRVDLPQTASFDTAFHRTQTDLVRRFALPRELFDQGIKHYGFHGLSYKFVAQQLPRIAPFLAQGRVIIAHLGSGASLCGIEGGKSRDTSMSFSTLDGIPMATRCGALDPGVLIHLVKERGLSIDAVEDILYHHSGLLGVSGISGDSRSLVGNKEVGARDALALFTLRTAREMAAIATTLGGLDGIVFTAGIGEHQPQIRWAICDHLAWLGVKIDMAANARHATRIATNDSTIEVMVVPTDEEQVIADEAYSCLGLK